MADLTTLASVKAWLGITSNTDDALLGRLITAYSEYVQTWLSRDLMSHPVQEVRDGTGGQVMVFAQYPVTAVASVVIDGVSLPVSTGHFSPGFSFSEQSLIVRGYRFSRGVGNVEISYTAGFASVPPEIEQAVIELIALRYKERDRIGHASKSLGGETVSYIVKDFPDGVRTILSNFRKVIPL